MQVMTTHRPLWAVMLHKARIVMDVIFHLGAHRTASTSFQHYLRENSGTLYEGGIGVWGPLRTRQGLLRGVIPIKGLGPDDEQFDRARGRIKVQLAAAERNGLSHVIVSDENMIGAARKNLREHQLYGDIGERMTRYAHAFGDRIARVVLSVRCQESYWASALAYGVSRGHHIPEDDDLEQLVEANRHWRDVIADLARAMPDADIQVHPYELFGGQPEAKLTDMTGIKEPPQKHAREWLNRAPALPRLRKIVAANGGDPDCLPEGDGRWLPFDREQGYALREAYADDMYWLRAGAGGLATLIDETGPVKVGQQTPAGQTTRGQTDGDEERRLA